MAKSHISTSHRHGQCSSRFFLSFYLHKCLVCGHSLFKMSFYTFTRTAGRRLIRWETISTTAQWSSCCLSQPPGIALQCGSFYPPRGWHVREGPFVHTVGHASLLQHKACPREGQNANPCQSLPLKIDSFQHLLAHAPVYNIKSPFIPFSSGRNSIKCVKKSK